MTLAAEQVGRVALVDLAERDVLVFRADLLNDTVDREVEGRDLLLGQLDVNLTAQAAHDGDGRHALDALEARNEVVLGDLTQRHAVEVALDADAHDRLGRRVELQNGRRLGVLWQSAAHAVDAGAHFVGRVVQVGAPGEVQLHVAAAFRRARVDLLEPGDGGQRLLERPYHELFDLRRTDAAGTARGP